MSTATAAAPETPAAPDLNHLNPAVNLLTFDEILRLCPYPDTAQNIRAALQAKPEECPKYRYQFRVEPMGIFDLTLDDLKWAVGNDPEDEARTQAIVNTLSNGGEQWPIVCVGIPGESWLAEGVHRLLAADFLDLATIPTIYASEPDDFGNEPNSDESNDSMVWLNINLKKAARDNVICPALELAKKHIGLALNADGESQDVTDGAALELICGNFLADPNFADPDEPQPSAEEVLRAQQGIDASCKMGMDVLYSESGITPPLAS